MKAREMAIVGMQNGPYLPAYPSTHTSIQQALDDVAGDTPGKLPPFVLILDGAYTEDVVLPDSDVHLFGTGRGVSWNGSLSAPHPNRTISLENIDFNKSGGYLEFSGAGQKVLIRNSSFNNNCYPVFREVSGNSVVDFAEVNSATSADMLAVFNGWEHRIWRSAFTTPNTSRWAIAMSANPPLRAYGTIDPSSIVIGAINSEYKELRLECDHRVEGNCLVQLNHPDTTVILGRTYKWMCDATYTHDGVGKLILEGPHPNVRPGPAVVVEQR